MAAPSFLPSWLYTDSAIAQWEQCSYAHHFWHPIAAASQLLCGQVLAVGGIKEKLVAAHRYGKKTIILPAQNWYDLDDIPTEILKELKLYPVSDMKDVLSIVGLGADNKKIKPVVYKKTIKHSLITKKINPIVSVG